VREKPKRADYVLYLAPNHPIAIVEAKDNNHILQLKKTCQVETLLQNCNSAIDKKCDL
jgi:type I site-specific restriction endonuclease